ncbi:S1/P1 nuclease [Rhodocyclus gracilis]|uniref:S1/P1 Nuclease n=1 Tax=Rhodocyclus tenuis TaxID=1066 RepID=A0A6L5JXJ3_RHOTE|nr:hypothetical protein [Rhodocyclus gracilis]
MQALGLVLLLGGLASAAPAQAWNATGHRLIAEIAWQGLDPATRSKIDHLLQAHPDYARWQGRGEQETRDESAFVEASTWADEIRHDPRFAGSEGGTTGDTPVLPGFPDMAAHRDWHFIDRPTNLLADQESQHGQLDEQLPRLSATLGNNAEGEASRAWALVWLLHLVGDAHQPLHVGCRIDQDGNSDEGGNAVKVSLAYANRPRVTSLHAYWDDLPGTNALRGDALVREASRLRVANPPPAPAGNFKTWLNESYRLARDAGYPQGEGSPLLIDSDFNRRAQGIAQQRLSWAGYRLASMLRQLLRRD